VALGPGAHAFDGVTRRWNAARLDGWLAALLPGAGARPTMPPGGEETPSPDAARAEAVVLALRTDEGVPANLAGEPPMAGVHAWAAANGLLETTPAGRLVLTLRGRLLSNELFSRLV
jgi:coproporphyrinogen III oxidase-like Fe-S oxidoreductase